MVKGFDVARKNTSRRLIVSVEGKEKSGKTSFLLSAPGPVCVVNLDAGLEGVADKWLEKKKILVKHFNKREAEDQKGWLNMWREVQEVYYEALAAPLSECRSVGLDTDTEAWELCRLALLGKAEKVMPHHYGPVNREYDDLIQAALYSDKNVIFLDKLKDEYVKDEFTGNQVRSGFKNLAYRTQLHIRTEKEKNTKNRKGKVVEGRGFVRTVMECRHKTELEGEEFTEPFNLFPDIAAEVFGTNRGEWE